MIERTITTDGHAQMICVNSWSASEYCPCVFLLDGSFRVRVHYIYLPIDGKQHNVDSGTWTFKLEDESISPESFLSILMARRNKCKTWIMIFSVSSFIVVCFCRLKVFHRIRQVMPDFAWFVVMYIVWSVDIIVVCLVGMSVWITLAEWMK